MSNLRPVVILPYALILLRLFCGIGVLCFNYHDAAVLIAVGFISDFLDGYLARIFKVSTSTLRRIDTVIDRIFWLCILLAAWYRYTLFLTGKMEWIILVLSLEVLNYAISFVRFRREVSTHAILAKCWAITLVLAFIELFLRGDSPLLFNVALVTGIISRIDTMLILLILRKWDHDIPSFYHAVLLRQGKPIRRLKLFNG